MFWHNTTPQSCVSKNLYEEFIHAFRVTQPLNQSPFTIEKLFKLLENHISLSLNNFYRHLFPIALNETGQEILTHLGLHVCFFFFFFGLKFKVTPNVFILYREPRERLASSGYFRHSHEVSVKQAKEWRSNKLGVQQI